MKKLLKTVLPLLLLPLFAFPRADAAAELHWYCTRRKDHKQPIADEALRVAENYGGYYIDRAHGDDAADRVVYLTFDAGYENGNVEKILNTLRDTETKGAFFVLSHFVKTNGDLARRMAAEGHLVCNHTARHPNLARAGEEKIRAEIAALERACAEENVPLARYFRPPEGSFSEEMLKTVSSLGYKTIFWSLAYADWDNTKQPDPERALSLLLANVHNGAVILLHPTSATNAAILPRLIAELRTQGYRFGTLNELCGN